MNERLRVLFCDHLSIARGKYLPREKAATGATRFARPTFGVHFDKDLLNAPGAMVMEGLPDMECRFQGEDIRDSWVAGEKIVVGDLYDTEGAPLGLCGRQALKRAIEAWEAKGLTPKVGIELECYALQGSEDGRLVPYDTPGGVVYGTGPFTDPLRFCDAIWEKAEAAGFNIEVQTAEYDAPQFEFTLAYAPALEAVDDVFLFRQLAREVALDHGILLTFMPKPIAEASGSGMHINFSFADLNGDNAFAKPASTAAEGVVMSDLAKSCVAGLVHHHKGLAGLVAPTANSYQRLQPASLSGFWQNWGGDHRGVTTRVSSETGAKARLEHRMADASANPYTAVAAVLQAARLGVEHKYPLPAMETGDCLEHTDAKVGTALDLKGATKDLAADRALGDAVGRLLCDNQIYMRREEVKKTKDLEGDALRDFYVHFI